MKTMRKLIVDQGKVACLEELKWHEVRNEVMAVNPRLATVIDQLDPGPDYCFFKARYPFGARFLDNGVVNLPTSNGSMIPLHDCNLPPYLAKKLIYSPIPAVIIIKNLFETFVEPCDRVVPLKLFEPGEIMGLWESLEPPTFGFAQRAWSITAGARSLFMLPKITSTVAHARLKKEMGVTLPVPRNLHEHWAIFTEIANHKNFKNQWHAELLFFSNKWFEKKFNDIGWLRFHHFLLQYAWEQSLGCRNKEVLDFVWEKYSEVLANKNLKPKPALIDTVKHLIHMGIGVVPGFRPAVDSQLVGPLSELQEVYVQVYGLKAYVPTIMQPYHLTSADKNLPVYYSLQSPSMLEYYPKTKNPSSIIADMRDLKELTDALNSEFKKESTPLYHFLRDTHYDYFHSEIESDKDIRASYEIPLEDKDFQIYGGKDDDRVFSDTCPFMRGCVRASIQT